MPQLEGFGHKLRSCGAVRSHDLDFERPVGPSLDHVTDLTSTNSFGSEAISDDLDPVMWTKLSHWPNPANGVRRRIEPSGSIIQPVFRMVERPAAVP